MKVIDGYIHFKGGSAKPAFILSLSRDEWIKTICLQLKHWNSEKEAYLGQVYDFAKSLENDNGIEKIEAITVNKPKHASKNSNRKAK